MVVNESPVSLFNMRHWCSESVGVVRRRPSRASNAMPDPATAIGKALPATLPPEPDPVLGSSVTGAVVGVGSTGTFVGATVPGICVAGTSVAGTSVSPVVDSSVGVAVGAVTVTLNVQVTVD
jgi:hypothetical protein